METTSRSVQPPLEFIPPAFNPWVCRTAQWVTPAWLHWRTHIDGFEYEGLDKLLSLMGQFEQGQTRLLLAFRHPTADDPLCLMQLFGHDLPKAAKRQGRALKSLSHFHFIYDRGIPLWAGDFVGWLYSRLGGIPIHRGKVDLQALRTARELLINGQFPLAAAPEGATNGHGEVVSPIEPGVAQLGVWAVQDLLKADRSETVQIVPIGIRYCYSKPPWRAIDRLLDQLEQDSGLTAQRIEPETMKKTEAAADPETRRYDRLYRLAQQTLYAVEEYYQRFHQQPLPGHPMPEKRLTGQRLDELGPEDFGDRLQALLNAALLVSEAFFNLPSKGSIIDRCRRLEQAGWDRIYREDLGPLDQLSAVELGLANRVAEEAQARLWHMRMVESLVAVSGQYVREKPTPERFAEATLLLWKLLSQLKGDAKPKQPRLGRRQVKVTIGAALSATKAYTQALETEATPRRAGRTAVNRLNGELQEAMEALTR